MLPPEESASTGSVPQSISFTSHFPIPSLTTVKGDLVNDWEFFKQQWTDYEVATGLDKQEQKIWLVTFRSTMGKECLQIFLNLKLTTEEEDIDECIKALEASFKPKRNIVYERYLFNMCQQNSGETMDSYVNRLQKAASTCQFGTLTEELIRDRLVIGLQDHSTKLRLLKEENLDMNKALNICRSSEMATQQLKAMKTEENKTEDVRAISSRQGNKGKSRKPFNGKKTRDASPDQRKHRKMHPKHKGYQCYRCGRKQRHSLESCPAFVHECKACKKPNHFASVWKSSQKCPIKQLTELSDAEQETDTDTDKDEFFYIKVEEVSSVQARGKQFYAPLEFCDPDARYKTKLDCQLDTGATCNVLTHRDLSLICQTAHPAIKNTKVKLRLFNGNVMKPLGEVTLKLMSTENAKNRIS